MSSKPRRHAAVALLLLAGCGARGPAQETAGVFPAASRPVSAIVSPRWSTEPDRDQAGEAEIVMAAAGIRPGMSVADIGAGEGYYTIRLARRVGPQGRVLAEDIGREAVAGLATRIAHESIGNVAVVQGTPADPKLPAAGFDRILLVHMYHEIESPYEFLWRMRPALKPGGRVGIVDADRPTGRHGTPPALLDCELRAVGYARVSHRVLPAAGGYLSMYEAIGPRPAPDAIRPCVQPG
ncbi:MAG: methyltransferase domain-containing protein [Sphingomonas sp.]